MEENKSGKMPTLTLDPEEKNIEFNIKEPSLDTIKTPDSTNSLANAGAVDESMLTEEEKQQVEEFVKKIDVSDVKMVNSYGASAQKGISTFSANITGNVKTKEFGEVGNSLRELRVAINSTFVPEKKGLLGLFQRGKQKVTYFIANYESAETNIKKIEKDLMRHQQVLTKDVYIFDQMYDMNLDFYKELTMYIIAGKKALAAAEKGKLQELKAKAESSGKQEDTQEYNDFKDLCHRFSKKISDLEITRVISIQAAPQVRMIQNNDRMLMDELQASLANTIPTWRNQLVISLGLEHSRRALEAQSTLREKTNELLAKNSETLKMATIESAKESERPIVDVETLQKCNRDLITSINEVVKIHEQGTKKREQAREQLVKMEEDLKQAMLEARK